MTHADDPPVSPKTILNLVSLSFHDMVMYIVRPLVPLGSTKNCFLLVLYYYFTKWVKPGAYQKVTTSALKLFIWKNIVGRHSLPY